MPQGLFYNKLQVCNLQEMDRFLREQWPILLSVTFTGLGKHTSLTNTLAYSGIRKLRIRIVFVV
jgi:hypothetical protein